MSMKAEGKFFIGGNWKCNGTVESIKKLVEDLNNSPVPENVEVVIAPAFIHLYQVLQSIKPPIKIAAQNCWSTHMGAYTGEVAAEELVDLGVEWVILGHSERRQIIGESNQFVGDKVAYALEQKLKVMACIGETINQRENGQMFEILDAQLKGISRDVKDWTNVVIAYEPVWAIGTGKVATPEQAQEAHAFVRKWLQEHVSERASKTVRILYGGSVNDKNANELSQQNDIDGFLVGGASLKGDVFSKIINCQAA